MNWIRMKDQKPTVDGMHLVYAPTADDQIPLITVAWWSPKNARWELIIAMFADAITHWMPLPEPPKEDV